MNAGAPLTAILCVEKCGLAVLVPGDVRLRQLGQQLMATGWVLSAIRHETHNGPLAYAAPLCWDCARKSHHPEVLEAVRGDMEKAQRTYNALAVVELMKSPAEVPHAP